MDLLFIDCCISQRGAASRTRALCQAYLDAYQQAHPQATITHLDLTTLELQPFNAETLNQREATTDWNHPIFHLANQFRTADAIVVGAPYWDMAFPAKLRIYMEHISCVGLTYHYDATGSHGDCHAKTLAYLTTAGGFAPGDNLALSHWQQLCGLFGIPRCDGVFAGGLDIDPVKTPGLLQQACAQAEALAGTH